MADSVVTNIESKTKATKYLSFQSLLIFVGYMLVMYMFKDYVYSILMIPYFIFNGFVIMFLLLPSEYNQGRNNFMSLVIWFRHDSNVYKPCLSHDYINIVRGERDNG